MHDCINLDRTLVSATNNNHLFLLHISKHNAFFAFIFYMYICLHRHYKGISKEIEFRCHIGKILTLKHNQSNVCVCVMFAARVANNCLGTKCRYIYIYIETQL